MSTTTYRCGHRTTLPNGRTYHLDSVLPCFDCYLGPDADRMRAWVAGLALGPVVADPDEPPPALCRVCGVPTQAFMGELEYGHPVDVQCCLDCQRDPEDDAS